MLEFGVYLLSFLVCAIGLSALDYAKVIRKGKEKEAQLLHFALSIALAYWVGNFLLMIVK
ncbi:MAG: DUF1146 domain-containing protein [Anaerorhabdus sp.]